VREEGRRQGRENGREEEGRGGMIVSPREGEGGRGMTSHRLYQSDCCRLWRHPTHYGKRRQCTKESDRESSALCGRKIHEDEVVFRAKKVSQQDAVTNVRKQHDSKWADTWPWVCDK